MELENLKIKILEDINSSKLRIDCIYYVIKDIYRDLELTYNTYLSQSKAIQPQINEIRKGETK
jgi:hypothetical protein